MTVILRLHPLASSCPQPAYHLRAYMPTLTISFEDLWITPGHGATLASDPPGHTAAATPNLGAMTSISSCRAGGTRPPAAAAGWPPQPGSPPAPRRCRVAPRR